MRIVVVGLIGVVIEHVVIGRTAVIGLVVIGLVVIEHVIIGLVVAIGLIVIVGK